MRKKQHATKAIHALNPSTEYINPSYAIKEH